MGFEFSPVALYAVKAVAAVVALVTAYASKGDALRSFLSKLKPKTSQQRTNEANKDAAWRELMNDSIERDCKESVDLLNSWMSCRTNSQLQTKAKQ